ncbi:MAG: vWA domain-containing protein [Planctomycetota bacterium]|jgi:Ca-activated chloride channel family protein
MFLLNPWFLALALLVPFAFRRPRGRAVLFAPYKLTEGLPKGWRVRLGRLPRWMAIAGVLLAILALARPVERVPLPRSSEGIDIVFCLDVSSSMTERDLDRKRTRLDVAKDAALEFIRRRPHDRIGLMTFARFPDLRCPPTLDHEALGGMLRDVELVPGDGPEDATGIGTAVARATVLLRGRDAKSRVVIVLTDGDENVATARSPKEIAPVHAGQLARELGIKAYTLTVGSGRRSAKGEWTELDTRQLRRLAQQTGGRFFEARSADDVAGVYAEIDSLEKVEFDEPRYRTVERFLPFLAAALALLLAGRFLHGTILGALP